MAYIMNYKDDNGNWVEIPVMQGSQGPAGPTGTDIVDSNLVVSGNDMRWYIKYSNGIMKAGGRIYKTNVAITSSWGSLYESVAIPLGNFLSSFSSTPSIVYGLENPSGGCFIEYYYGSGGSTPVTETSAGLVHLVRPNSSTITSCYITYEATGKWN